MSLFLKAKSLAKKRGGGGGIPPCIALKITQHTKTPPSLLLPTGSSSMRVPQPPHSR